MKDKKYYPDEKSGAADIVREIFQRYADGDGHRDIAISLGDRGVRTKYGNMPDNRWIEYVLNNPCYTGKLRWSMEGVRAVSKRDYDNQNVMIIDGHHEPLIPIELWERVQKRLAEQKKTYPAYSRRDQPIEYMLKGLVRCSNCGSTLAASGYSGKAKVRCLQCCNYARGSCHTSHSITLPRINAAIISGLENAIGEKQFIIAPRHPKKADTAAVDYDKLIAVEERRLVRAREAYLAEIDTIEQYAKNKVDITARISELMAKRDESLTTEIDVDSFAQKVADVVDFIKRDDVSEMAKNEALRTIIEKIIYEKANNNLAIYFHDL
jgi:hypothetical protein